MSAFHDPRSGRLDGYPPFRALHAAGATFAEIARETGCDWRTVKKYLAPDAPSTPPRAPACMGSQPKVITPFVDVVDAWLRAEPRLKGSVIHERLVAQYGFTGNYQRVKMYLQEARPRILAELGVLTDDMAGLHRRFEVTPGSQAQVDWGEEAALVAGLGCVYAFHMTLSYSRDPFCCFTTSMDMAAFWDCHRQAFAHFGGVPGSIVYDRTKTVVRRHVAPGAAVPLHPEAAAFAEHYGFAIDVLAAYRPTGKGRVERQVAIVRDHVITGRVFDSLDDLQAAFDAWLPIRRGKTHRTHGEVIAVRATRDRNRLLALPARPYLVADKHLRRVGKDCPVSFQTSLYSVPARNVRAGQQVEIRATASTVTVHALTLDEVGVTLLAAHPRATQAGSWVVDQTHWDGLPDGHTRATTLDTPARHDRDDEQSGPQPPDGAAHPAAPRPRSRSRGPLSSYDTAAGLTHPRP
ncbi:IS21 family transposase [Phytohabitans kaempferiae]|uniref:IS21 family transposase n=1 Tax=Phytohabitans kaempferiae TaxID=1620943 RepID=A0ABV6MI80_9ACTN